MNVAAVRVSEVSASVPRSLSRPSKQIVIFLAIPQPVTLLGAKFPESPVLNCLQPSRWTSSAKESPLALPASLVASLNACPHSQRLGAGGRKRQSFVLDLLLLVFLTVPNVPISIARPAKPLAAKIAPNRLLAIAGVDDVVALGAIAKLHCWPAIANSERNSTIISTSRRK